MKGNRFLLDLVTGYAEEGGAFLRRRKQRAKPYARIYGRDGEIVSLSRNSTDGAELFAAADTLLEGSKPAASRGKTAAEVATDGLRPSGNRRRRTDS